VRDKAIEAIRNWRSSRTRHRAWKAPVAQSRVVRRSVLTLLLKQKDEPRLQRREALSVTNAPTRQAAWRCSNR